MTIVDSSGVGDTATILASAAYQTVTLASGSFTNFQFATDAENFIRGITETSDAALPSWQSCLAAGFDIRQMQRISAPDIRAIPFSAAR